VGATAFCGGYDVLNAVRWCQIADASKAHATVCSLCVFELRSVKVRVACWWPAGASQAQNHAQNCTYSLYSMYMRLPAIIMSYPFPGHAARGDVQDVVYVT